MLTYDASREIIKCYPWLKEHERELEACIVDEAEHWHPQDSKVPLEFAERVERAYQQIIRWIHIASEYRVDVEDPLDVASFVASHRKACVWSVLISKHYQTK